MRAPLVAGALLIAVATAAPAQNEPPADLDALLQRVESGRAQDVAAHREREQRFREARDQQKVLLDEARGEQSRLEARSEKLENTYDAKELEITNVQEQLDQRLGSLRELFGVLQQVSSDARAAIENSVTSAQLPERGDFLGELGEKLGSSSSLPSVEDIERLWYLMQQEMTETGKVVKFPATVITSDGREIEEDVVRIGGFTVVSPGRFLQYTPETGNLSELSRQPQPRFTKSAARLFDADREVVTAALDPTRGQILATYLDRPSLRERIDQGGVVGYVILILGALGLVIALERLVVLGISSRKVSAQLGATDPSPDNPLGRVLQVAQANDKADVETLELKLGEAVFREQPKLTRTLLFIKIISVVAPLLGLLGTVTGMIVTFQAITLFGTGDPKLMAGGISQALVTTVEGLVVAIPMVLLHTLVSGRSRRILHILQEQSAGIVAERSAQGA